MKWGDHSSPPTTEDAMTLEELYDYKTVIKVLERLIDNEIELLQEDQIPMDTLVAPLGPS